MSELRPITASEARAIDRDAHERLGMPTLLLMENASRSVAEVARSMGERFLLLCGSGNNGGDGLAAARHLGRSRCRVHLLDEPDAQRAPDAALQARILRAAGWDLVVGALPDRARPGEVLVDALFGTGLSRPLAGAARAWVEFANLQPVPRLAVDLPSGLHADTGMVLGAAVRADTTVTFVAPKVGMTLGDGPRHSGRIVTVGLGLP